MNLLNNRNMKIFSSDRLNQIQYYPSEQHISYKKQSILHPKQQQSYLIFKNTMTNNNINNINNANNKKSSTNLHNNTHHHDKNYSSSSSLHSQSIRKRNNKRNMKNQTKLKKKLKSNNQINVLYQSQVSQMWSDISIPTISTSKINKSELKKLQSRIVSQILSLRQQKIIALQNLNKITDKKNKAIQLVKNYALKQTSRFTENQNHLQLNHFQNVFNSNLNNHVLSNQNNNQKYNINNINISKLSIIQQSRAYQQQYQKKQNKQYENRQNKQYENRQNKQLNKQYENRVNAISQANKICEQLMKPLNQHPLLCKNRELKLQLQQIQQQFINKDSSTSRISNTINHYKSQNDQLQKQIMKQKLKLNNIQKNRFQTFFPQDKKKIDQINLLIKKQRQLISRKQMLNQQIMNKTIISKTEDQINIEELQEQNKKLLQNCQNIIRNRLNQNPPSYNNYQVGNTTQQQNDLYSYSVEQLENMVQVEEINRKNFLITLNQFKQKIALVQNENNSLKSNLPRISYYY